MVATQNPIEYEGTYPLPEAQLDRFLLKLNVALPAAGGGGPHPAPVPGRSGLGQPLDVLGRRRGERGADGAAASASAAEQILAARQAVGRRDGQAGGLLVHRPDRAA